MVVCLAVLGTVGVIAALNAGRGSGGPATPDRITAAKLRELPARPEDIETHGKQAETLLGPDAARKQNAAVPFAPRLRGKAKPFVFKGSEEDRARALRCLATAAVYEAGDDPEGEAAVAQVVLNRVRHAAFPVTICGVVYQGAERRTGCQFTFTCDGSLQREIPDEAWRRARQVADRALSGEVDEAVGLATHYHTDWVYPYWSPELRKLARVGTHLFFGWPGYWGSAGAFRRKYRGNEQMPSQAMMAGTPGVAELAGDVNPAEPKILGLPQPPAKLPPEMGKVPLYGNKLRLVGRDGHSFGLVTPPEVKASQVVNAAMALCKNPGPCRVNAWANEDDVPGGYPLPAASRTMMVFEFVRAGNDASRTLRFDCARFPNKDLKVCLETSGQVPELLKGIRWKGDREAVAPQAASDRSRSEKAGSVNLRVSGDQGDRFDLTT